MTSCTETSVGISASENPNADPRTARVTVSYPYSAAGAKGTASCEITVAQSCGDQPAISVQPTAVAAATEGGDYSFEYTIVNPASDGEVSASCSASWISDINTSTEGTVGFGVAENTATSLRQAEITLSYSWPNGSVSETVTVVQDHQGGSGNDGGNDGDITGTYTMTGVCYESYPYSASWTVTIHYDPGSQYTDSENPYLIDGLIYAEVGDYSSNYSAYCAKARVENGNIIVPSQITQGKYNLDETGTISAYLGYVAGYIDSDGYLNAYDSHPDMVFTYNAASESWSCNYGIMGFLYDTPGDFGSFNEYFIDFTVGDITLVKSGSGGGGGDGSMVGTYTAHALVNGQGYSYQEVDWTVKIYPYEGSLATGSYDYWMDGVIPWGEGAYAQYGDHRASAGIRVSGTTVRVPTQFANATLSSSSGEYHLMYTPCTKYEDGSVYYSSSWPDLTFTYNSTTGVWTSDYGVFMGGSTSSSSFALSTYFQVATPVITLTKTSDTTSLSVGDSSRPVTSFENLVPNFSFRDAPVPSSSNGIKNRKAGLRAAR